MNIRVCFIENRDTFSTYFNNSYFLHNFLLFLTNTNYDLYHNGFSDTIKLNYIFLPMLPASPSIKKQAAFPPYDISHSDSLPFLIT